MLQNGQSTNSTSNQLLDKDIWQAIGNGTKNVSWLEIQIALTIMVSDWKNVVNSALDRTEQEFRENPANFSDERSLAENVRTRLIDELGQATVEQVIVEDNSSRGPIPDHKEYTSRYEAVTDIDCAQCEIGGQEFPYSHIERIDLGLFDDGITITLDHGTQEFDPNDLLAAFEFKYVKNINYLRHTPESGKSKYTDITKDIERLGDLPSEVERWFVLFGNYDLLRKDHEGEILESLRQTAAKNSVFLRVVLPELD